MFNFTIRSLKYLTTESSFERMTDVGIVAMADDCIVDLRSATWDLLAEPKSKYMIALFNRKNFRFTGSRNAIQKLNVDKLKSLIAEAQRAYIDLPNAFVVKENLPLLSIAISLDKIDLVKVLLENGARVDLIDTAGKKPIDYARSIKMKVLLIEHTLALETPTIRTKTEIPMQKIPGKTEQEQAEIERRSQEQKYEQQRHEMQMQKAKKQELPKIERRPPEIRGF